jgi:hypothetical protein
MAGAVAGSSVPGSQLIAPTVTVLAVAARSGKPPTMAPLTVNVPAPRRATTVAASVARHPGGDAVVPPMFTVVPASNVKFGSVDVRMMWRRRRASRCSPWWHRAHDRRDRDGGLRVEQQIGAPSDDMVMVSGDATLGGRRAVMVLPSAATSGDRPGRPALDRHLDSAVKRVSRGGDDDGLPNPGDVARWPR